MKCLFLLILTSLLILFGANYFAYCEPVDLDQIEKGLMEIKDDFIGKNVSLDDVKTIMEVNPCKEELFEGTVNASVVVVESAMTVGGSEVLHLAHAVIMGVEIIVAVEEISDAVSNSPKYRIREIRRHENDPNPIAVDKIEGEDLNVTIAKALPFAGPLISLSEAMVSDMDYKDWKKRQLFKIEKELEKSKRFSDIRKEIDKLKTIDYDKYQAYDAVLRQLIRRAAEKQLIEDPGQKLMWQLLLEEKLEERKEELEERKEELIELLKETNTVDPSSQETINFELAEIDDEKTEIDNMMKFISNDEFYKFTPEMIARMDYLNKDFGTLLDFMVKDANQEKDESLSFADALGNEALQLELEDVKSIRGYGLNESEYNNLGHVYMEYQNAVVKEGRLLTEEEGLAIIENADPPPSRIKYLESSLNGGERSQMAVSRSLGPQNAEEDIRIQIELAKKEVHEKIIDEIYHCRNYDDLSLEGVTLNSNVAFRRETLEGLQYTFYDLEKVQEEKKKYNWYEREMPSWLGGKKEKYKELCKRELEIGKAIDSELRLGAPSELIGTTEAEAQTQNIVGQSVEENNEGFETSPNKNLEPMN